MIVGTALAAADVSSVWACHGKHFFVHLTGTMDTNTVTLQASPDNGKNWFSYYADDASGTPAVQAFTATHVPSTSAYYVKLVIANGFTYRLIVSGEGTSAVNAYVTGELISPVN